MINHAARVVYGERTMKEANTAAVSSGAETEDSTSTVGMIQLVQLDSTITVCPGSGPRIQLAGLNSWSASVQQVKDLAKAKGSLSCNYFFP